MGTQRTVSNESIEIGTRQIGRGETFFEELDGEGVGFCRGGWIGLVGKGQKNLLSPRPPLTGSGRVLLSVPLPE